MSAHDLVRFARLVAAFGFSAFLTCTATGRQTGEVSGCITHESAVALANATVVIAGTLHGTRTGIDGCYLFERVSPGAYQMRVHHEGFVASETTFVVADGESVRVDVVLRPLAADLFGEAANRERARSNLRRFAFGRLLRKFSLGFPPDGYRAVSARSVQMPGLGYAADSSGFGPHVLARFAGAGPASVADGAERDQSALSFDASPYIEAGIASNTGWRYLDAGLTATPRRTRYAVRFLTAGAGSYTDGAGSTVPSSWSGGLVSARVRHVVGRTSLDFEADALVGGSNSNPTSRLDEEGTTSASAGVTVRRLGGEDYGTSYTLGLAAGVLEADLDVESWSFDELVSSQHGERNVSSSYGVFEVSHAASDHIRLNAGVRLQSDAHGGSLSPNPSDADPWPDVRDRTASLDVGATWSQSSTSVEGSLSISQARSRFRSSQGLASTDNAVLPSADLIIRFGRASALFMYEVTHSRALTDPRMRQGSRSYFPIGQTEVIADGNPDAGESASTMQEFTVSIPRGATTLEVGMSFEILHEFPFIEPDAAGDPATPWRIATGSGWIAAGSMGLEYAPVELARVGVVTRVIRARNATADEPLARIPSSIVGGYVELGAPGGHPYLRWVTLGRLARNRFADSVDERETSYSVVSDIEAGGRFRRLRFALGVRNLGDRRIRDHVDGRIENVVPLNAPGRQLTIRVRYLVD